MQRPKLHLRDLFWVVALAALALGWYREHTLLRRALHETKYDLLEARQRLAQAELLASSSWVLQKTPKPATATKRPPLSEQELDAALQQAELWQSIVAPQ